MNTLFRTLCLLCLLVLLPGAVFASPTAVSGPVMMPPEKPEATDSSPAAAQLGQQLQALVTGGAEEADLEPQDTFGTRALGVVLAFVDLARDEGMAFINNFAAIPQAVTWFMDQLNDQRIVDHWTLIGQLLLSIVGSALAMGWVLYLGLAPMRQKIARREPKTGWGKAEALLVWLFMALMPLCVFLGASLFFLGKAGPPKFERYVVLNVVYAIAMQNLVRVMARFFLKPRSPQLRLLPIQSNAALYLQKWIGWLSFVMILGYFCVDLARIIRMPAAAITAFSNLIGFFVVVMTVTIIAKKRAFVSTLFRGNLSAAHQNLSLWQSFRLWLARTWHILAIAYLVIGYTVTTLGGRGNFALMQRGTILTLLVLVAIWLASYMTSKLGMRRRRQGPVVTSGIYRPVFQGLLRLVIWVLGIAGIMAAWGVDVEALIATPWGQRILGSAFSITTTVVIVVLIYEVLHVSIERRLNPRDAQGKVMEVNSRARTLLPMLRNAAIIVLAVIVGMVTLSELGINIAPLIAGAGVLGVAVGFGSQTLVKDFLTGLFIILEDTIAVGDVVSIGDHSGVVDSMALRTIRLRDDRGAVHILPYSEITKLINMTKNYAFAVIDLRVAYKSDLDHVMNIIRAIGKELRAESEFSGSIVDDLEMLGIESFGDSAIVLRCRIKTKPGKQWDVKRAFLLRVKLRFDQEEIEIPYSTVALLGKLPSLPQTG